MLIRILRHLFFPSARLRRLCSADVMDRLETAIREGEQSHSGEVLVILESSLSLVSVLRRTTARERARELFRERGVWDTEGNNGVLIYLLMADRDFEIVADRAIDRKVGGDGWAAIAQRMEEELRAGRLADGILLGVREISAHLARHFPGKPGRPDELSDRPALL